MLRPLSTISQKISQQNAKEFIRTKVQAAALKPKEKLKLWHIENKGLFGPLLETGKQKKQRVQKSAKNRTDSHQNNNGLTVEKTSNSAKYTPENVCLKVAYKYNPVLPMEILKRRVWQNTRSCANLTGLLINPVRGLKTFTADNAARSSPAQSGYSNDDKILQIRPHKMDYAQQYPSVTLILNKTMTTESQAALEKWKQERIEEMGAEEFDRFYQAQMAVGTKFHKTLKDYFTQPRTQLRIEKDVEGVWTSVAEALKSISTPKAIESNVVHPQLKYRGIFDAIADYEDKPTLIEWKKSDKPRKSILQTFDNPVQLAAYFGAVCNDLNYKHLNVRDALLVIAYTDGSQADVYHLSTDKLREHWAQWLIRLEQFVKQHGTDDEKILKGGKRLFEEDIGNLQ